MTHDQTSKPRFEAVLYEWYGESEPDDHADGSALCRLVEEACRLGLQIGVVGDRMADPDALLGARPDGPGALHLLSGGGSDIRRIGRDGTERIEIGPTAEADPARWFLAELWRLGIGPELVLTVRDGSQPLATALEAQIEQRHRRAVPRLERDPAWCLHITGVDRILERVHESLLNLADGRMGTAGTPLGHGSAASPAVLLGGVYTGEGADSELAHCPVWNVLPFSTEEASVDRTLDLHTGLLRCEVDAPRGTVEALLFSSLSRPGTASLRAEGSSAMLDGAEALAVPTGGDWRRGVDGDRSWLQASFGSGGVVVAAGQSLVADREPATLERICAYGGNAERLPPVREATARLAEAQEAGYERLLAEHRAAWAERWRDADVRVGGDEGLQLAVRLALFHLMASVGEGGEVAVGARGLSGSAYKGHVFWDACAFVLPFLAATHPQSARAMLEYRVRRLPAALRIARREGRRGARFPWESAASGEDVTPAAAFSRAGESLPVLTGTLEEHIVADVAWGVRCYVEWSRDTAYLRGAGGRLVAQTARYWASRIVCDEAGAAHIRDVMGPDEYHAHVDDNAFTNVMARWNLRFGAHLSEGTPSGPSVAERERWLALADVLVDGYDPASGIYEQFAGFRDLEPLVIADLAPRRPIAADLLLGRERIESAQVLKQADVLMLHHLVPEEVEPGSLAPNLAFYEPRTAHASSLSPGIHAGLLARAGRLDAACEALDLTASIDLDDISETTGGGLHLAAMGSLWQALALGFAGLRPRSGVLEMAPTLPPRWTALDLRLRFGGIQMGLEIRDDHVLVTSDEEMMIVLGGERRTVGPEGAAIEYDAGQQIAGEK